MRTRSVAIVVGALTCAWLLGDVPRAAAAGQDLGTTEDRPAALRAFTEGIERYAALRARYEMPLPPFDGLRDPWSLRLSRHFLASAIRTARHQAAAADLIVDLVVNEPVPAWAMQDPLGRLLARLPSLPSAIEYRLVGDTLVLWDTHAEILIDALPGALIVP